LGGFGFFSFFGLLQTAHTPVVHHQFGLEYGMQVRGIYAHLSIQSGREQGKE
jgi:hypothetical protein